VNTEPLQDAPKSIPIHEPTTIIADPQPQLTPSEIRKLRRQFVTVTHPRVEACGHRLDLSRQPRMRNCQSCWLTWLNNHGELVQTADELHNTEGGVDMLISLQGVKFLKWFRRFMAGVASLKPSLKQEGEEQ
jgi:hypothetical protein